MRCLIQSCKGKKDCLEHCPCDCHKKQFCDCYDHDLRAAIRKLAQIVNMNHINEPIRETATMYLRLEYETSVQKYIKNLEEKIHQLENKLLNSPTPASSQSGE